MWSVAYGLIAMALVAFVALYAAVHTPHPASVSLADQLYAAKYALAQSLPNLPRVDAGQYTGGRNVVLVYKIEEVYVPVGYVLERAVGNVNYGIAAVLTHCERAVLPGGVPSVLYVIEASGSLDVAPWLEAYAAVADARSLLNQTLVGVPPPQGAVLIKTPHSAVYNRTVKIYITAPAAAYAVYLVDYPLYMAFVCPEAFPPPIS